MSEAACAESLLRRDPRFKTDIPLAAQLLPVGYAPQIQSFSGHGLDPKSGTSANIRTGAICLTRTAFSAIKIRLRRVRPSLRGIATRPLELAARREICRPLDPSQNAVSIACWRKTKLLLNLPPGSGKLEGRKSEIRILRGLSDI